jgi:electron transport complex protein RnfC
LYCLEEETMPKLLDFLPEKALPLKKTLCGFIPRTLIVPFTQESGINCVPLISEGDIVTEGQLIGKADSTVKQTATAAVHAPIPGRIEGLVLCSLPDGRQGTAARITLEGSFSFTGKKITKNNWSLYTPSMLVRMMDTQGIVNTFKISEPQSLASLIENKKKNSFCTSYSIVVRLFDEDPSRITDTFLASERMNDIRIAAAITAKAAEISRVVFVYDADKQNPVDETADAGLLRNITVDYLGIKKVTYPDGFRRTLIARAEKTLKAPSPVVITNDDIFVDVSTMVDLYDAIVYLRPVTTKFVYVTGDCIKVDGLFKFKIGTTFRNIVAQVGGFCKEPAKIIVNGFATGTAVGDLDIPVTKYVKSLAFISVREFKNQTQFQCIRCGNCRRICPASLYPDLLYFLLIKKIPDNEYVLKSAQLCTECGLCNSVCTSRLPLSQYIKILKES